MTYSYISNAWPEKSKINKAKKQQKHYHQIQILKEKSQLLQRKSNKCLNPFETNGSPVFLR